VRESLIGPAPPGYDRIEERATVDHGAGGFARARAGLFSWALQRAAGIDVDAPTVVSGTDMVLRVGIGLLQLTAPCRVGRVVDEPGVAGFAYATRPGHPERGEEQFVVTLDDDGTVTLTITGWSRPATWYARLGAPVTRLVQRRFLRAYLGALTPDRAYRGRHD
jgi:uncharacterized protein (UPF0548 family)